MHTRLICFFAVFLAPLVATHSACAQSAGFHVPEGWSVSLMNACQPGQAGFRIMERSTGIEMVYVPAGEFMMGSNDGSPDEQPVHRVRLDAYWLGRTELSVGQWLRVADRLPPDDPADGTNWNDRGGDHPLLFILWDEANAYCAALRSRLGLRLPTEAEWEYAACGPKGAVFPWGDDWDATKCCNNANLGPGGRTLPVGSLSQGISWCGALDMAGNAAEWCSDWYGVYGAADEVNPTGPPTGVEWLRKLDLGVNVGALDPLLVAANSAPRVSRGGSWLDAQSRCFRCTDRHTYRYVVVHGRKAGQGFRCARSAD
ncbi:MAG: formylglycine-generating enzyme family protein [Armatimonadetes bacterium]|nr:formylglycine-generating enzyme family protein [Armatimonadota bacterium]